jgi:hypothetical protein
VRNLILRDVDVDSRDSMGEVTVVNDLPPKFTVTNV